MRSEKDDHEGMPRAQQITLGVSIALAVFSIAAHVAIREWYSPDVRYELGGYYQSSNTAITSLKLHNFGHADAEELTVNAFFPERITDIKSNDGSLPFEIVDGGKNARKATGTIRRLVPDQTVYIYFSIAVLDGVLSEDSKNFVESVTYKGGIASTGEPILFSPNGIMLSGFIAIYVALIAFIISQRRALSRSLRGMIGRAARIDRYLRRVKAATAFGRHSGDAGIDEAEFVAELKKRVSNYRFRRKHIFKAGLSAFKARQTKKALMNRSGGPQDAMRIDPHREAERPRAVRRSERRGGKSS